MVYEHTITTCDGSVIHATTDHNADGFLYRRFPAGAFGNWQYSGDWNRRVAVRPIYAGVDEDGDFAGAPIAWERRVDD